MPFVFSLAALLSVRRRREEAEERHLAQLSADLATARQTLHRIETELRRLADEHAAAAPRTVQATHLHERYARLSLLEQGRSEVSTHVHDLTERFAAQQQAYLRARCDRELLEELETTQRATYAAGLLRQETKRNDDAFLNRYLRN